MLVVSKWIKSEPWQVYHALNMAVGSIQPQKIFLDLDKIALDKNMFFVSWKIQIGLGKMDTRI